MDKAFLRSGPKVKEEKKLFIVSFIDFVLPVTVFVTEPYALCIEGVLGRPSGGRHERDEKARWDRLAAA
jgi:hypothetical protein